LPIRLEAKKKSYGFNNNKKKKKKKKKMSSLQVFIARPLIQNMLLLDDFVMSNKMTTIVVLCLGLTEHGAAKEFETLGRFVSSIRARFSSIFFLAASSDVDFYGRLSTSGRRQCQPALRRFLDAEFQCWRTFGALFVRSDCSFGGSALVLANNVFVTLNSVHRMRNRVDFDSHDAWLESALGRLSARVALPLCAAHLLVFHSFFNVTLESRCAGADLLGATVSPQRQICRVDGASIALSDVGERSQIGAHGALLLDGAMAGGLRFNSIVSATSGVAKDTRVWMRRQRPIGPMIVEVARDEGAVVFDLGDAQLPRVLHDTDLRKSLVALYSELDFDDDNDSSVAPSGSDPIPIAAAAAADTSAAAASSSSSSSSSARRWTAATVQRNKSPLVPIASPLSSSNIAGSIGAKSNDDDDDDDDDDDNSMSHQELLRKSSQIYARKLEHQSNRAASATSPAVDLSSAAAATPRRARAKRRHLAFLFRRNRRATATGDSSSLSLPCATADGELAPLLRDIEAAPGIDEAVPIVQRLIEASPWLKGLHAFAKLWRAELNDELGGDAWRLPVPVDMRPSFFDTKALPVLACTSTAAAASASASDPAVAPRRRLRLLGRADDEKRRRFEHLMRKVRQWRDDFAASLVASYSDECEIPLPAAKVAIDEIVLQSLYDDLFNLYKIIHYRRVDAFNDIVAALADHVTPALAGVDEPALVGLDYAAAIAELAAMGAVKTLRAKASALERTHAAILAVAPSDYLSADNLLPLFIYLLLKAKLPHSLIEVDFLAHFSSDDVLRGFQAYLTMTLAASAHCIETTFVDVEAVLGSIGVRRPATRLEHMSSVSVRERGRGILSLASNGHHLLASTRQGLVHMFDVDGHARRRLAHSFRHTRSARIYALGALDRYVIGVDDAQPADNQPSSSVAPSPSGLSDSFPMSESFGAQLVVWDSADRSSVLARMTPHTSGGVVKSLAIGDAADLWVGDSTGRVTLWALALPGGVELRRTFELERPVLSLVGIGERRVWAAGIGDCQALGVGDDDKRLTPPWQAHNGRKINQLAFDRLRRRVWSVGDDGAVEVRSTGSTTLLHRANIVESNGAKSSQLSVALSDSHAFTSSLQGTLIVFAASNFAQLCRVDNSHGGEPPRTVRSVLFDAGSRLLHTAAVDGVINIWHLVIEEETSQE
jgi:Vacuolar sorting protein 9 (VPS9) domain